MLHDDPIREQAVAWAVRTGDPDFDDWDGFGAWLEQDPRHSAAYDLVASAALDAAEALPDQPLPANDVPDAPRPRWNPRRWWPAAIAACVALVFGITLWGGGDASRVVETGAGETQMIALEDGSRIDLAGGSRIVLDRGNPRFAALERGQALFTIRHDEADPFILDAGKARLVDAGTVFDVRLNDGGMAVGVSEGAVIFNPDAQNVHLGPGDMLTSTADAGSYEVSRVALAQVGEWREGRLSFRDAPLPEVAAELTRATGLHFLAAPGAGGRKLSGSILIAPVRDDPHSLGPLLGVSIRAEGGQWLIGMP